MAYINNVIASWSMIQLKVAQSSLINDQGGESGVLINATSIKWSSSRKAENIYGLGGQPRGRGFGNVTYNASITLPYNTQDELRTLGSGSLIGLGEFDIIVSWANDLAEKINFSNVTLKSCFFSESSMEANQDDTSITHEFDLHPYRIYDGSIASTIKTGDFRPGEMSD